MSSSKSSKSDYYFGSVTTNTLSLLNKGSVTQGTAITSGVALPAPVGFVKTVSSTLSTIGSVSFAAAYPSINDNSIIFASIGSYAGNGTPNVRVSSFSAGSCTFTLSNVHPTAPLSAPVTIAYQII